MDGCWRQKLNKNFCRNSRASEEPASELSERGKETQKKLISRNSRLFCCNRRELTCQWYQEDHTEERKHIGFKIKVVMKSGPHCPQSCLYLDCRMEDMGVSHTKSGRVMRSCSFSWFLINPQSMYEWMGKRIKVINFKITAPNSENRTFWSEST